jgi:ATP-dependent Clp protease ATP-binding subunit ClpA
MRGMARFDEAMAQHIRAAERLAREAGLDLVGVAHVLAALAARPSWLREQLADEADAVADAIVERLGRGDGGLPAWSPRLRDAVEHAGARGVVDELALLAQISQHTDGIVAEVLARVGPVPQIVVAAPADDAEELIPAGGLQVWPPPAAPASPREIEVIATGVRIGPPTPTLDRHGRDLVAAARAGQLREAYGREPIFEQIVIGLARHTKPNVILVGEPGVGKTAIVEGLGVRLARAQIPELAGVRLVALEPAALVAGTGHHGELEDRVRRVLAEATHSRTLLFIDEIHRLLATGTRGMSAADVLKPALARGELRVIGATTAAEYAQHIARDPALARRFERVDVAEPDADGTLAILRGLRAGLERTTA